MNLFDYRDDYKKEALLKSTLEATPQQQFQKWLREAISLSCDKANAMTLSTVNPAGQPRGRIVLLKELNERGFVFFSNYESIKGLHINENPKASICFYWTELERQVIVQGTLHKIPRQESIRYFNSRPIDSQISAAISAQSQKVTSRNELIQKANQLSNSLSIGEYPKCPESWGGYALNPTLVEFWQGRPDRMHDRFEYNLQGATWNIDRLSP